MNQINFGLDMANRISLLRIFVVASLLMVCTPAFAHKLNIFAFVESGQVKVDGYFVDGTKVRRGDIIISDAADKALITGKTDDEGHFEFPVPGLFDLKITLDAGMGHRAEWVVPVADLGQTSGAGEGKRPAATAMSEGAPSQSGGGTMDRSALREVVDAAVAEAIKPLVRALDESRQHASVTQIVGSIGYIVGLFGIWAYFKGRGIKSQKD